MCGNQLVFLQICQRLMVNIFPTSLDESILPLQPKEFSYIAIDNEKIERVNVTMKLRWHDENLEFIWGRNHNLDDCGI